MSHIMSYDLIGFIIYNIPLWMRVRNRKLTLIVIVATKDQVKSGCYNGILRLIMVNHSQYG